MTSFHRICLVAATFSGLSLTAGLFLARPELWQPAAVILTLGLTLGMGGVPALRSYRYTAWILTAVTVAMVYPGAFLRWGDFDLRSKWLVLAVIQLVMFGMGTQMSLRDFAGVVKMPWGVIVALLVQFTMMPLIGWSLTKVFEFPDEIAAGVILIGCCSSGLASNVMCYIARGNLALSITATAMTTLLAPLMTPLWMKTLAGALVEVNFFSMMGEIIKMVIVPIGAALLHDYLKHASGSARRRVHVVAGLCAVFVAWLLSPIGPRPGPGVAPAAVLLFELVSFGAGAIVFGVVYHAITRVTPALDRWMPFFSMAGIVYFTTVTTAAGRDNLLTVGGLLVLSAMLHNSAGYFFGYWLSRAAGLNRNDARTIALETGLQNGGMGSGLAASMGKLATVGLASAIFSPWMNISGSLLANYWRRRPVDDVAQKRDVATH